MTHVVIMNFHVAPGREREFEDFVAERSRLHRGVPGFLRMYLLRPTASSEYRVVTWWKELEKPDSWIRKEAYAFSEAPQHLGLVVGTVPSEVLTVVREF